MKKEKGIALLEVLLSTIVITMGLLGVILLMNQLIASRVEVSIRDKALFYASNQLESFKNVLTKIQFEAIQTDQRVIKDENGTTFTVKWKMTRQSENTKSITIQSSWDGFRSADNQVDINYLLSWKDPLKIASVSSFGVIGGFQYLNPNPKNYQQSELFEINNEDIEQEVFLPVDHQWLQTSGGTWLLLDEQKQVQLQIDTPSNEETEPYISVQGNVYVPDNLINQVSITATHWSYCIFPIEKQSLPEIAYKVYSYQCFMPKNWRGKVGLISTVDKPMNFYSCPAKSREYLSYLYNTSGHLTVSGISASYQQQDFIVTQDPNSCESINQGIAQQSSEMTAKNTDQLLELKDKHISFAMVNLLMNDEAHSLRSVRLTSSELSCRLLSQLSDRYNYHCALNEQQLTGPHKVNVIVDFISQKACSFTVAMDIPGEKNLDVEINKMCLL